MQGLSPLIPNMMPFVPRRLRDTFYLSSLRSGGAGRLRRAFARFLSFFPVGDYYKPDKYYVTGSRRRGRES